MRASQNAFIGFLDGVGEMTELFGQSLWSLLSFSFHLGDVIDQMAIIGVNSLPLVLLTIAFSGMVLALYTAQQMVSLGLGNFVGGVVAITMSREAAPVLAAIVISARAGSAIAAEIGSMKVTEQIDALRAMAVNPVQYLVVPRFIALVFMLPVVTMLADLTGTGGGFLVASASGVSYGSFTRSVQRMVSSYDINTGLLKTLVFGAIIALVSCQQGLKTRGGAAGVGRATTQSVVLSIVLIYVADFILVRFLFAGGGPHGF
jgi:phospholipid/cholesterol/gamma-HCH transport system permease protein